LPPGRFWGASGWGWAGGEGKRGAHGEVVEQLGATGGWLAALVDVDVVVLRPRAARGRFGAVDALRGGPARGRREGGRGRGRARERQRESERERERRRERERARAVRGASVHQPPEANQIRMELSRVSAHGGPWTRGPSGPRDASSVGETGPRRHARTSSSEASVQPAWAPVLRNVQRFRGGLVL